MNDNYYKTKECVEAYIQSAKNNDIKRKELITSFQEKLIIGKSLEIEGNYTTVL